MLNEEFNNQLMSHILEKISFENKRICLLGDFNINVSNYETGKPAAEFLNNIHSNSFVLYTTILTRITPRLKTLISNIFLNDIN